MIALNMIKSAPVGPVAGGIMGCIMVLVLAVYAYRHQIHRRSHQHMSPLAAQGECIISPLVCCLTFAGLCLIKKEIFQDLFYPHRLK